MNNGFPQLAISSAVVTRCLFSQFPDEVSPKNLSSSLELVSVSSGDRSEASGLDRPNDRILHLNSISLLVNTVLSCQSQLVTFGCLTAL